MINFETSPDQYKHWKLTVEGEVATLTMDVQEDATLAEGYKLKLNSYDLGVDIELADAIQRLRFEHPEVKRWCSRVSSHESSVRRQHLHAWYFVPRLQS